MSSNITGLEEVQARLQKLIEDSKAMDGSSVPIIELFSQEFMQACSEFLSFEEFLDAGGFQPKSAEEFQSIPIDALTDLKRSTTIYSSWPEMKDSALGQYAKKRLGL